MLNTQQNNMNETEIKQNEIEQINKEINLLQDRLKKDEKSQNQFQDKLMQIKRIQVKKWQRPNLSQTKNIQNIVKNILQNKTKQIKKNTNLIQNILAEVWLQIDKLQIFVKPLQIIYQQISNYRKLNYLRCYNQEDFLVDYLVHN